MVCIKIFPPLSFRIIQKQPAAQSSPMTCLQSTTSYHQRLIYGHIRMPQLRHPSAQIGFGAHLALNKFVPVDLRQLAHICVRRAHVQKLLMRGRTLYGRCVCGCDVSGANCAISPCVKSYKARVQNFVLEETEVSRVALVNGSKSGSAFGYGYDMDRVLRGGEFH